MEEPDNDTRISRAVWLTALVVVAGSVVSILDATIVNVALRTLSAELETPIASVQWVVTGYLLALAAVIPVSGWAARRVGARRLYLVTLVLFTTFSMLCGLAWSIESLVVFRVLQGLGGGMLLPTGMIILARAAGPHRIGRVLGVMGIPIIIAPVFGPVIGGLLVEHVGWRWIFFVNLPVGIVAFVLAVRLLAPSPREEKAGPLDWLGVALLAIGLPTITYGLAEAGSGAGFASPRAYVPIAAGIILATLFVLHALRVTQPLLNVRLYRIPAFAAATATNLFIGASLYGGLILVPLYFQIARGESVLRTGLLLVPQAIAGAIAVPIAGRFTDRHGGGPVAVTGLAVAALATIPLALATATTSYAVIEAAVVLRGVGVGISMMPTTSAAYAVLSHDQIPDATPQLNVIHRLGGSIGAAVLAVALGTGLEGAVGSARTTAAFSSAYWMAFALSAVAVVPATILLLAERSARRTRATASRIPATEAALEAV